MLLRRPRRVLRVTVVKVRGGLVGGPRLRLGRVDRPLARPSVGERLSAATAVVVHVVVVVAPAVVVPEALVAELVVTLRFGAPVPVIVQVEPPRFKITRVVVPGRRHFHGR